MMIDVCVRARVCVCRLSYMLCWLIMITNQNAVLDLFARIKNNIIVLFYRQVFFLGLCFLAELLAQFTFSLFFSNEKKGRKMNHTRTLKLKRTDFLSNRYQLLRQRKNSYRPKLN